MKKAGFHMLGIFLLTVCGIAGVALVTAVAVLCYRLCFVKRNYNIPVGGTGDGTELVTHEQNKRRLPNTKAHHFTETSFSSPVQTTIMCPRTNGAQSNKTTLRQPVLKVIEEDELEDGSNSSLGVPGTDPGGPNKVDYTTARPAPSYEVRKHNLIDGLRSAPSSHRLSSQSVPGNDSGGHNKAGCTTARPASVHEVRKHKITHGLRSAPSSSHRSSLSVHQTGSMWY